MNIEYTILNLYLILILYLNKRDYSVSKQTRSISDMDQ